MNQLTSKAAALAVALSLIAPTAALSQANADDDFWNFVDAQDERALTPQAAEKQVALKEEGYSVTTKVSVGVAALGALLAGAYNRDAIWKAWRRKPVAPVVDRVEAPAPLEQHGDDQAGDDAEPEAQIGERKGVDDVQTDVAKTPVVPKRKRAKRMGTPAQTLKAAQPFLNNPNLHRF
jgi:hypothetical protein